MAKATFADICLQCEPLLEQQQFEQVIEVFAQPASSVGNPEEWKALLAVVERIPQSYRLASMDAAVLYAKALKWCRQFDGLAAWAALVEKQYGTTYAPVQLEWASGLLGMGKFDESRILLRAIIPHLAGESLGMAWARLGFALYKLKEPTEVWRGAYQSAYPLLTGEERGRAILNEGYCLGQNGQRFEAQAVLLQALTCFKNNPYFLAWTRYNIAMYALHELAPHAEKQFLEAIRHSHSPKAAGLRPAASNGLGAFRRSQGEWKRAEAAYRTALRLASDPHDRQQAHQGIARTQYLAGQPGKALETLAIALQDPSLDPTMLYVYQALAFLTQGDPKAARNALRQAGEIESDSDRWLYRIARAELARLDGTEAEAVALLEGLPLESLHAREEVRQWPRLFELVAASGGGLPQPLEHSDHTTIEVQALGMARVWVNGREVPLAPLNRATELLVALLEKGGQATSHQLIEMLWPNTKVSEKRRHLSELIGNLREALGWPSSVRTVDRGYALADEALWLYDVQDARAKGQAEGIFMDGLYSNWVQEVNEELNAYRQLN